jgi:fermentation-respiration switch protein FrsA (DUF1100 family)
MLDGTMDRTDVTFPSRDGRCAAWLYRPDTAGPAPLVAMAHGFSATRDQRLDAYAERFCAAGLGVLLFDYRHFGASAGEPRQLLDIPSQIADYGAALHHARQIDWVDADRIALFGSSFSGGHVLTLAAHHPGIAAVVAQCPYTDPLASFSKLGPVNLARATVAGLFDQLTAFTGLPPYYIAAVGDPGTFAVMTTPDSKPGFAALTSEDSTWENRVAARIALRATMYRPGAQVKRIACPVLFCVCDDDSVAPAGATLKHAATAPRGEIKRYPIGHFDIYIGEAFEQAVADQTEFLVRHLQPQGEVIAETASPYPPSTRSTAPVT